MTIAKDITSKASVALVVLAMIFTLFAQSAQAEDSAEDLQALIATLTAQINSMQAQLAQGGSTTGTATTGNGYVWTRDLSQGSTGADVKALQVFLNSDADTRVAATGAGSVGLETEYYGPATAAAVSKFQVKYRSEILSPSGLVNPTGYFGPSSRAKANTLNTPTSTPTTPTTPGEDVDEDEEEEETVTLQGEAALNSFEINDAEDDEVEEGDKNAEVAVFTPEFSDGDAKITRLDVELASDTSTSTSPWKAFKSFALWVDGEKVAEVNADAKSNYKDGDVKNSVLRFTGLDIVALEDEELEITLSATVSNSVKTDERGAWTVSVPSFRYVDADGVATTESDPSSGDSAQFSIGEAGDKDELRVLASSNNPAARTLKLETNKNSDWYTLLAFDIDSRDSVNDIDIDEIVAKVKFSSTTIDTVDKFNAVVDKLELKIDGVTITKNTVATTSNAGEFKVAFDVDNKVTIDAGDRIKAEVNVRFRSLNAGNEGVVVTATVAGADITAEGVDTIADLSGTATGKDQTLSKNDITVSNVDSSVTGGETSGFVDFQFTIKAGDDVVTILPADILAMAKGSVTSVGGASVNTATDTAVVGALTKISGDADVNGAGFDVLEGQTVTLRVRYAVVGTSGEYAEVRVDTIKGEKVEKLSPTLTLKS